MTTAGRPPVLPTARIIAERQAGATLWGIANSLTADGIHTAKERHELTKGMSETEAVTILANTRGTAVWKANSVRAVLHGRSPPPSPPEHRAVPGIHQCFYMRPISSAFLSSNSSLLISPRSRSDARRSICVIGSSFGTKAGRARAAAASCREN